MRFLFPFFAVSLLVLAGCQNQAAYLIEKLSLDPCEIGSVDFNGVIDTNPLPFMTANVHVEMHEEQTAETRPEGCGVL